MPKPAGALAVRQGGEAYVVRTLPPQPTANPRTTTDPFFVLIFLWQCTHIVTVYNFFYHCVDLSPPSILILI